LARSRQRLHGMQRTGWHEKRWPPTSRVFPELLALALGTANPAAQLEAGSRAGDQHELLVVRVGRAQHQVAVRRGWGANLDRPHVRSLEVAQVARPVAVKVARHGKLAAGALDVQPPAFFGAGAVAIQPVVAQVVDLARHPDQGGVEDLVRGELHDSLQRSPRCRLHHGQAPQPWTARPRSATSTCSAMLAASGLGANSQPWYRLQNVESICRPPE